MFRPLLFIAIVCAAAPCLGEDWMMRDLNRAIDADLRTDRIVAAIEYESLLDRDLRDIQARSRRPYRRRYVAPVYYQPIYNRGYSYPVQGSNWFNSGLRFYGL